MNQELVIQDSTIAIDAKNLKPDFQTLDFLECSGIVPSDWKLARQPISANNMTQVMFTNGIAITAEPQRIILGQPIRNIDASSVVIREIAGKYASALPNMESKTVNINFRGYVLFASGEQDIARQYITQTLLSPGAWQSVGEAPIRASLDFFYELQRAPFHLKVTEAALQTEEEKVVPIIMFSGSYSYSIRSESNEKKLAEVHSAINNWQSDLEEFQNIVNNKFLAQVGQQTLPTNGINPSSNLFAVSA